MMSKQQPMEKYAIITRCMQKVQSTLECVCCLCESYLLLDKSGIQAIMMILLEMWTLFNKQFPSLGRPQPACFHFLPSLPTSASYRHDHAQSHEKKKNHNKCLPEHIDFPWCASISDKTDNKYYDVVGMYEEQEDAEHKNIALDCLFLPTFSSN